MRSETIKEINKNLKHAEEVDDSTTAKLLRDKSKTFKDEHIAKENRKQGHYEIVKLKLSNPKHTKSNF